MLTIRKKRPAAEATVSEATALDATVAEATTDAPPAPMAMPLGLEPEATAVSGGGSAKHYTVFAILGIAATLCVMVLVALQFMEFSFYKADPSVWPVK